MVAMDETLLNRSVHETLYDQSVGLSTENAFAPQHQSLGGGADGNGTTTGTAAPFSGLYDELHHQRPVPSQAKVLLLS
jgi:hypothetical protein